MNKSIVFFAVIAVMMAGCVKRSVNDVGVGDAGQAYSVMFGTVIEAHRVNVRSSGQAATTGGALAGAGAGAALGRSDGAVLAGMLVGAVAGAAAHNAAETGNAVEYTIAFTDGSTKVIDQVQGPEDEVFQQGASVMVQFGANVNRVLSAEHLPDTVKHPKTVKVQGTTTPTKANVKSCQSTIEDNTLKANCSVN